MCVCMYIAIPIGSRYNSHTACIYTTIRGIYSATGIILNHAMPCDMQHGMQIDHNYA